MKTKITTAKKREVRRDRLGKYAASVVRARIALGLLLALILMVAKGYSDKLEFKPVTPAPVNAAWLNVEPTPTPVPDQQVESFIKSVFGKHGKTAVAVAKGECRGLNTRCLNKSSREWSVGTFQINIKAHFAKIPGNTYEEKEKWLFDWKNNVVMAKVIFDDNGGFRPWTAYLNKSYLQYLE